MSLLQRFNQLSADAGASAATQLSIALHFIEQQNLSESFLAQAKDALDGAGNDAPRNLQRIMETWMEHYENEPYHDGQKLYLVEMGEFDEEDTSTMVSNFYLLVVAETAREAKASARDIAGPYRTLKDGGFDVVNSPERITWAEYYYLDDDEWKSVI